MRNAPRISVSTKTWDLIASGQKTTLLQVDDRIFAKLSEGRPVKICRRGGKVMNMMVVALRRHRTLTESLEQEDLEALGHGELELARLYLLDIYDEEPPEHHCFVVLELEPIQK